MTPNFTQWLTANFLDSPTSIRPAADAVPPHCTGVQNCLEHILAVVGGDMSLVEENEFRANIEHCRPCYDEFDVQLAIRQAIRHKIKEERVPESILDQIRDKIFAMA